MANEKIASPENAIKASSTLKDKSTSRTTRSSSASASPTKTQKYQTLATTAASSVSRDGRTSARFKISTQKYPFPNYLRK